MAPRLLGAAGAIAPCTSNRASQKLAAPASHHAGRHDPQHGRQGPDTCSLRHAARRAGAGPAQEPPAQGRGRGEAHCQERRDRRQGSSLACSLPASRQRLRLGRLAAWQHACPGGRAASAAGHLGCCPEQQGCPAAGTLCLTAPEQQASRSTRTQDDVKVDRSDISNVEPGNISNEFAEKRADIGKERPPSFTEAQAFDVRPASWAAPSCLCVRSRG